MVFVRGRSTSIWGLGARPPKIIFFILRKIRKMNFPLNLSVDSYTRLLRSLKFWKKSIEPFSRKWGSKFWGRGTFSSSPTWGVPFPHLTLGDFGPRDPDKNGFCSGDRPPIWGRYGVWPVCTLAHFFSKSVCQILDFFANRKCVRPAIDSEILKEIYFRKLEQISLKVVKKHDISLFCDFCQVWLAISRSLWKLLRYNYDER